MKTTHRIWAVTALSNFYNCSRTRKHKSWTRPETEKHEDKTQFLREINWVPTWHKTHRISAHM